MPNKDPDPQNDREPTSAFSRISIIFNPNSTGDGKAMAKDLKADLRNRLPGQDVKLIPTKHAGHAEELSYKFAKAGKRPLIISASGDGGYHEVVNGIIQANKEGAGAVAGLLPAGNANDHYHDAHKGDIGNAISKNKTNKIDLIELKTKVNGKEFKRYAHSYIGFGLTPKVGKELNKVDLNWFNERIIAVKTIFAARPVKIVINGKRRSYDSLVFSNVSIMSKVLNISPTASNTDGLFELTFFKHRSKVKLLLSLLRASTIGLSEVKSLKEFNFHTTKKILVQLDGEIYTVDANSEINIKIAPKVLECVV